MKLNDWLTLIAIIVGPLSAVGITLWIDNRRRRKERRLYVTRMLLMTRHLPADPQYNAAINLIPVEFNDQPKVIAAWRTYHERAHERVEAVRQAEHDRRITAAQSGMIFEILRSAGFTNISEGDIQTQAYVSTGFIERDNLYLGSLRALVDIAETMEKQRVLTQRIVDALPQRPAPPNIISDDTH